MPLEMLLRVSHISIRITINIVCLNQAKASNAYTMMNALSISLQSSRSSLICNIRSQSQLYPWKVMIKRWGKSGISTIQVENPTIYTYNRSLWMSLSTRTLTTSYEEVTMTILKLILRMWEWELLNSNLSQACKTSSGMAINQSWAAN